MAENYNIIKARQRDYEEKILNLRVHDLVYFAGLFDGEGSVGIYLGTVKARSIHQTYTLKLCITNTHKPVMEWVQLTFGGSLRHYAHPANMPAHWKPQWRWEANCRHAGMVAKAVVQHSIIKKKQLLIAVEFSELLIRQRVSPKNIKRGEARLSDDDHAIRVRMAEQVRALKDEVFSSPYTTPKERQMPQTFPEESPALLLDSF